MSAREHQAMCGRGDRAHTDGGRKSAVSYDTSHVEQAQEGFVCNGGVVQPQRIGCIGNTLHRSDY